MLEILNGLYSLPGLRKSQRVDYQHERDCGSLVQLGYTRQRGGKAPWPSRSQIAWMLRTGQLTPRIQQWMREKGTDPEQFRKAGFTYEQLRDELQQLSQRAISQNSSSYNNSLKHQRPKPDLEL